MSGQINLREVFISRVRNELYGQLMHGPLKGWEPQTVISFVDEAIEAKTYDINSYLSERNVTLMNMNDHIRAIIDGILLPYLNQKRVE